MANLDTQYDNGAAMPEDVSRVQDVLVTIIVALIGTAVALGLYMQAGFGAVPSLSIGGGLFVWLLSAHFLITRMRLKRLVQGRLAQLTKDVKKLKNELQVTDLLAEGHDQLRNGQDAFEKAIGTIVERMDHYDRRLKVLQKLGKISLDSPKREELTKQSQELGLLNDEFQKLSQQVQGFEHRHDLSSKHQYSLMKAQLDVLEFVVRQTGVSGERDRLMFVQKALEAIAGLRQIPLMQEYGAQRGVMQGLVNQEKPLPSALPSSALPSSGMSSSAVSSSALSHIQNENEQHGHRIEERAPSLQTLAPSEQKEAPLDKGGNDKSLLTAINEAIEANRIELFLQPIVGLAERELVYYEAFSRLRNDIGQLILPRDFIAVAEMADLVPIIDNQIILRSIQVIQRLMERGKGRTVFCNLSIASLRDADFFSEFLDFLEANKWLADYLVFEFSQEGLENAGSYEFERMAAVSKLGFRFSLDQINRLDLDFKALADRRFGFVKINSSLLLGNMEGAKAQIHSADLDHYLRRLNITLIVDKVEREAIVRQLREYNVRYAQGTLFCEPKPVRPEVYGAGNSAGSVAAA